jgi:hypothetical protein
MTLTIQGRKSRPRRVTEKSFEDAFAKVLTSMGIKNYHMNMREAGWPDRYLRGGMWIEFKVIDALGVDNGTEPEQRAKMHDLTKGGDYVYYCARFQDQVVIDEWKNVAGKSLAHVQRFQYRDKRDLEHIIRYVILGEHSAQEDQAVHHD